MICGGFQECACWLDGEQEVRGVAGVEAEAEAEAAADDGDGDVVSMAARLMHSAAAAATDMSTGVTSTSG